MILPRFSPFFLYKLFIAKYKNGVIIMRVNSFIFANRIIAFVAVNAGLFSYKPRVYKFHSFMQIKNNTILPLRKNVTGCSRTVDGGNAPTADKFMSIAIIFDRE